MGQSAATASQDFHFTSESDSFRRKVLLLYPPPNLHRYTASLPTDDDYRPGFPIATLRLLRSMMVSVWRWDGEPLLAEQWGTVLSGHDAVVCFIPRLVQTRKEQLASCSWDLTHADDVVLAAEPVHTYPPDRLLKHHLETALQRVQSGSQDAVFLLAIVDVCPPSSSSYPRRDDDDATQQEEHQQQQEALQSWANYYWYDPEDEALKAKKNKGGDDGEGSEEEDNPEDRREESVDPNELLRRRAEAIKMADLAHRKSLHFLHDLKREFRALWTELPAADRSGAEFGFLSECLLTPSLTPIDLARPLCSLLDQLREACDATGAFLLDSVTLLPLLDTLPYGSCATPTHLAHRTLWSLRRAITVLQRNLKSDLHVASLSLSDGSVIHLGWACRPYALVLLISRGRGLSDVQRRAGEETTVARNGPLMLESNLSYFSMHFSNVIYNKTLTRDYRPIAA